MSESDNPKSPDYVQNALEATCDALMTLEQIGGSQPAVGTSPTALHVAQAIASLRLAISELRLARNDDATMVALGFVVPVPGRSVRRPGNQARRHRTA